MSQSVPTVRDSLPPERLGEYVVVRALGEGYLALPPHGRQIVLKPLSADCLLNGQLHPSIKERLHRVRELAQKDVATLQAVERIDGVVYLLWQYVSGQTWEEYFAEPDHAAQASALARELIVAVESLHSHGLVHGQIHERNVLIDERGDMRLTHLSPLLFNDPEQDVRAIIAMLSRLPEQAREQSEITRVLARKGCESMALRVLAGDLLASEPAAQLQPEIESTAVRRRSLVAAAVLILLSLLTAWLIDHTITKPARTVPAGPILIEPAR